MVKKLTRTGNSMSLVIDKPLLEQLGIDEDTQLELSTDGHVLVVAPLRDKKRRAQVARLAEEAHARYGGVFKKLSE